MKKSNTDVSNVTTVPTFTIKRQPGAYTHGVHSSVEMDGIPLKCVKSVETKLDAQKGMEVTITFYANLEVVDYTQAELLEGAVSEAEPTTQN